MKSAISVLDTDWHSHMIFRQQYVQFDQSQMHYYYRQAPKHQMRCIKTYANRVVWISVCNAQNTYTLRWTWRYCSNTSTSSANPPLIEVYIYSSNVVIVFWKVRMKIVYVWWLRAFISLFCQQILWHKIEQNVKLFQFSLYKKYKKKPMTSKTKTEKLNVLFRQCPLKP